MCNLPIKIFIIRLNCLYTKRFGHMQPPVVKYQFKRIKQVTKNKLSKIHSDIEKNVDNWN